MDLLDDISLRFVAPSMIGSLIGYVFFTSPFVLYILARWRAHREPTADPQLGIKLALGYLAAVGLQIALIGGTVLLYAIITKETDERGTLARIAFGLLLPGFGIYLAHRLLLTRTNQDDYPAVRRLLAGYNLLLVGMIGLVSVLATFQALFAKGSSGEGGRLAVATLLIYGPAWGFHSWRVFADRTGAQMPPPPSPPTGIFDVPKVPDEPSPWAPPRAEAPPPSKPPEPAKPGLPPLGGGSFPPVA